MTAVIPPDTTLPALGYIHAGQQTAAALAKDRPETLLRSLNLGRSHYTAPVMALGDRITAPWLEKNATPYKDEIFAIHDMAPTVGGLMLNMSFEWSCTTCAVDNNQGGNKMLRVLDWMLDGLGRETVIVTNDTDHGPYHNITWIGYAGVITAMAPGRFSAAINQPPMRKISRVQPIDWLIARKQVLSSQAMPPHHLLRLVFETCPDFDSAKKLLTETPICIPAFFTLSGTKPGEGCCIERLETEAFIHDNPSTFANHFLAAPYDGYDRGTDSQGRYRLMEATKSAQYGNSFDWVRPPILNKTTRLAVIADAAAGDMTVRAYEADGKGSATPASRDFVLSEHLSKAA